MLIDGWGVVIHNKGGPNLIQDQKQNLYNEAIAFYDLAELGRKYSPEQKHIESHIPYIVNMVFCIELLLKLLLVDQGEKIKDIERKRHDVEALYNLLSDKTKQTIKETLYPRETDKTHPPFPYKLDLELQRTKNAFVKWRYLVLDKIHYGTNEKDQRIPFSKWRNLSTDKKNKLDEQDKGQRLQVAPFFLKGFSEALMETCMKKKIVQDPR